MSDVSWFGPWRLQRCWLDTFNIGTHSSHVISVGKLHVSLIFNCCDIAHRCTLMTGHSTGLGVGSAVEVQELLWTNSCRQGVGESREIFSPNPNILPSPMDVLSVHSFMSQLHSKQPLRPTYWQTRAWSILHFYVLKEDLRVKTKFSFLLCPMKFVQTGINQPHTLSGEASRFAMNLNLF